MATQADTGEEKVETPVEHAAPLAKSLLKIDEMTPGEELLRRLKEENKEDEEFLAARDEFVRRAQRFELHPCTMDLLNDEPFYGSISRRVNKARTMRVPTAAVTVLEDMFLMLWNPTFFTRIAPDAHKGNRFRKKAQGVLMHEFMHLILHHVASRRTGIEHHVLWNWATDLSINGMLPREKLPDGLLCPGEPLDIPEDAEAVYDPKHLEKYKELSDFIAQLPKKLSAEDYYGRLLEHIKQHAPEMLSDPQWGMPQPQCTCDGGQQQGRQQGEDEGDDSGGGSGEGDQQDDGDGDGASQGEGEGEGDDHQHGQGGKSCNQHGDDGEGQGQGGGRNPNCPVHGDQQGQGQGQGQGQAGGQQHTSGYGRLGQFDDHDKWDEVDDQEREFIKQRVKNMLRDAVNEADNDMSGNGWGSVPSEMQGMLRKLISDQIDWRALLRQFVGFMNHMNTSSTMKKINRRYPYIHPGRRRARGAKIRIYIDQSGSVSDSDIALLFGELDNLSKKCDFEVFFFDTEVDEDSRIDWKRGQKHPAQRNRCGGTDFNAPTQHANKNREGIDGIMILTDGECYKPEPCVLKRGWVITPGRQLMFETDELVIQMTEPQKTEFA